MPKTKKTVPKWVAGGTNPLDEVVEVIQLPAKSATRQHLALDPSSVELSELTVQLLHDYIAAIAALYHDNHFHCFEQKEGSSQWVVVPRNATSVRRAFLPDTTYLSDPPSKLDPRNRTNPRSINGYSTRSGKGP